MRNLSIVATNAGFSATGRGYKESYGPGVGIQGGGGRAGGGGYGGRGGRSDTAGLGGNPYGSSNAPVIPGSGGGSGGGIFILCHSFSGSAAASLISAGGNGTTAYGGSGGGGRIAVVQTSPSQTLMDRMRVILLAGTPIPANVSVTNTPFTAYAGTVSVTNGTGWDTINAPGTNAQPGTVVFMTVPPLVDGTVIRIW